MDIFILNFPSIIGGFQIFYPKVIYFLSFVSLLRTSQECIKISYCLFAQFCSNYFDGLLEYAIMCSP